MYWVHSSVRFYSVTPTCGPRVSSSVCISWWAWFNCLPRLPSSVRFYSVTPTCGPRVSSSVRISWCAWLSCCLSLATYSSSWPLPLLDNSSWEIWRCNTHIVFFYVNAILRCDKCDKLKISTYWLILANYFSLIVFSIQETMSPCIWCSVVSRPCISPLAALTSSAGRPFSSPHPPCDHPAEIWLVRLAIHTRSLHIISYLLTCKLYKTLYYIWVSYKKKNM